MYQENNWNTPQEDYKPWGMELNQFCMLMHLSQFLGFIAPLAGLILPIIMWSTNRDKSEVVDQHGKNIMNWLISELIYFSIGAILSVVLIGIPIVIAVFICSIIFTILGGIRAGNGEYYVYPFSIKFFK